MDKRTRNLLIIAGLGFVVFYIARRTAAKISVGNAGVRIHKLTFSDVELRIDLPVINESQVPATVTGFLGQIFYGPDTIGVVQLQQPTSIPGFGQVNIPFSAKISVVSALQQVYGILINPPVDWSKFSIKGTLLVQGLPITIDQKLLAA